jgi:hypothetical protein
MSLMVDSFDVDSRLLKNKPFPIAKTEKTRSAHGHAGDLFGEKVSFERLRLKSQKKSTQAKEPELTGKTNTKLLIPETNRPQE